VSAAFRRHPWWSDGLLAAVLTLEWFAPFITGVLTHSHPWWDWVLLPLTTVPLVVRRYRPAEVFVVVACAYALALALPSHHHDVPFSLSVAIATYTLAWRCGRPLSVSLGLRVGVVIAIAELYYDHSSPADALAPLAFFGIAWAVGDNIGTRRAYLAELEARAERLEREREEQAARATLEERARIARELHDVIAHNVSVMVIQASAGEELFDSNPQRAREALSAVASTGRDALGELRRLLGVIRPDPAGDEPPSYDPQPGLAALPELLDQVRDTGLAVTLAIDGESSQVPEAAALCAYRIVQEALTNTINHAGATRVDVELRYCPDALVVSIRDDGGGGGADGQVNETGGGRGLIGMRERVALFGGHIDNGPTRSGGYQVTARLPLPGISGNRER
jgi:signal transduction histidine kinase